MRTRPSPHIPGFEPKTRRYEPRLSDVILGVAAVAALVVGCLCLLAAVA